MDIGGFKTVPHLKLLKKLEVAESAALRKCIEMQEEREQGEMRAEPLTRRTAPRALSAQCTTHAGALCVPQARSGGR